MARAKGQSGSDASPVYCGNVESPIVKIKNVAIVGAGFAGLASAALLARQGHRVTVFEKFSDPQSVGAGVLVQPTGIAAMRVLRIADEIIAAGARVEKLWGIAPGGRPVVDIEYRDWRAESFGVGLHRGVLFNALWREACNAGADIVTGHAVEELAGLTSTHDLTVLADGAHSRLRAQSGLAMRHRIYPWGALWAVLPDIELRYTKGKTLLQWYDRAARMLGIMPTGSRPGDRAILALCDAFHTEGRDLLRVLGDLQAKVRQASLDSVRQGGTSALLGAPLATEQLVRVLECLQAGEQGIRQGLSPRANFEVTLLKAIEQSRARSIDLLIKDIAAASAGLPREPGEKKINRYLVPPVNLFGGTPAPAPTFATTAASAPAPAVRREAPAPIVDVPIEDNPSYESSLPPMDVAGAEEEADQAAARSAFDFPVVELPVTKVAETGKSAFPGDPEFQAALAALPAGLAEKLRSTLGAEFTALRPVPAGKLRRPA